MANIISIALKATQDLIKSGVDSLNDKLTTTRAAKMDNIDTTISSRQPDVLSTTQANRLDANISSRAAASTALSNTTWTNARAGYLDEIVADTREIVGDVNSVLGDTVDIQNRCTRIEADTQDIQSTLASGSSAVKSVQRGVATSTANEDIINVTISSVNMSKALAIPSSVYLRDNGTMSFELTSSTNLKITCPLLSTVKDYAWQVIEFN